MDNLVKVQEPGEGGGEDPIDPPTPTNPEPKTISVEFGKEYDINANDTVNIQTGDANTTIIMPDNLPEDTKVIVADAKNQAATTNGNLMVAGDVFDISIFGPNNEKVNGPFTLTMAYDKDQYSAEEVDIYYYDEDQEEWIKQKGTVNEDEGTIKVEVDHFSMYGVLATSAPSTPGDQDKKSGEDEDKDSDGDIVKDPEDKDADAENALPKTATNTFNMIAIGLILLALGGTVLFFIRRKAS